MDRLILAADWDLSSLVQHTDVAGSCSGGSCVLLVPLLAPTRLEIEADAALATFLSELRITLLLFLERCGVFCHKTSVTKHSLFGELERWASGIVQLSWASEWVCLCHILFCLYVCVSNRLLASLIRLTTTTESAPDLGLDLEAACRFSPINIRHSVQFCATAKSRKQIRFLFLPDDKSNSIEKQFSIWRLDFSSGYNWHHKNRDQCTPARLALNGLHKQHRWSACNYSRPYVGCKASSGNSMLTESTLSF